MMHGTMSLKKFIDEVVITWPANW